MRPEEYHRGLRYGTLFVLWPLLLFAGQPELSAGETISLGFRVPEGFEVTLFADDDLAHNLHSLTLDAEGRVVVAGPGFVKVLHDDDGDGKADRSTVFSTFPADGARGMYFDGPDLICTGEHALSRLNGSGGANPVAVGEPRLLVKFLHRGGHEANGVVKGPDGWYYVACGNDAGVSAEHATTPGSPVKRPQQGVVLRVSPVSPDGRQSEIVAHGFRNPYDLAFDWRGNLLLVDADGERDQYLPWYSPTRLFDVAPGMHHGWMISGWQRSWNHPERFFDNVERLVEIGRGSPTGALVYLHRQFPERYRGGMFSCCWSLGRIYHFALTPHEDTFRAQTEIFLEAAGDAGFAPVDMEVGPDGDLFVAIGGRGTKGSVYRVSYTENGRRVVPPPFKEPIEQVLSADQPLTSWSRAKWVPVARELGGQAFMSAAIKPLHSARQRVRAIEILVEMYEGVNRYDAPKLVESGEPDVTARMAWALSRVSIQTGLRTAPLNAVAKFTFSENKAVRRAAWEALSAWPPWRTDLWLEADWEALTDRKNRRLRAASILAAARLTEPLFRGIQPAEPSVHQRLAYLWRDYFRDGKSPPAGFQDAVDLLEASNDPDARLELVRLMQISLGDLRLEPTQPDVYAGYLANDLQRVPGPLRRGSLRTLAPAIPSGNADLDRELARLLGMLGEARPGLLESLAGHWTDDSRIEDDIHYLIVMSLLPGERSEDVTKQTATALARLHGKMIRGQFHASDFWPARVGETFEELARRDERLAPALLAEPDFKWADQAIFAARMTPPARDRAARQLLAKLRDADPDEAWTADLVNLVATLPAAECQPTLRRVWENLTLRDTVVLALARFPRLEDRDRFVDALQKGQPATVQAAGRALAQLGGKVKPAETLAAVRLLRQYSREGQYADVARELDRLLEKWTQRQSGVDLSGEKPDLPAAAQAWQNWFLAAHPGLREKLTASSLEDAADLPARLAKVAWSAGDIPRGKAVFERRNCARCHTGTSRLGPDLAPVASRFSRDDLFLNIVDPNREVSPTYRATQVVTASGKLISGQIIYESPAATLVQTGPDTTVRVSGAEIVALRKSHLSPMPAGLLREATDRDLADLYAYLRSLAKR